MNVCVWKQQKATLPLIVQRTICRGGLLFGSAISLTQNETAHNFVGGDTLEIDHPKLDSIGTYDTYHTDNEVMVASFRQ